MSSEKQRFTDNTYSLAKGLHHINIAKQYFEDVRYGTSNEIKAVFNQYIQKCDWILANMRDRMGEEQREVLKKEMEDSLTFDAINDKLIYLDNSQRAFLEELIDAMIKSEEVKMIDTNDENTRRSANEDEQISKSKI